MKVLLVYPRLKYEHAGGLAEPLGLLYIASTLKNAGHEVSFIDLTFFDSLKALDKEAASADLIGLSATTALYGRAQKVLGHLKNKDVKAPVIIGGPHPTIFPESCVEDGFDFSIIGEGENITLQLVTAIESGQGFEQIKGIAYRDDAGEIECSAASSFIEDIDKIPTPARAPAYYKSYFKNGLKYVGLIATRGCPFKCIFCKPMQDKLFGSRLRKRSVLSVVEEIEEIESVFGHCRLNFKDDTITTLGRHGLPSLERTSVTGAWLPAAGLRREG